MNEAQWIEALKRALPRDPAEVLIGIGDDAAVIALEPGEALVATVDDACEDSHFRWSWAEAEVLGGRAAGASISDLAAMGARPLATLLSLRCPGDFSKERSLELARGLGQRAAALGCPLIGGNLSRAPGPVQLSVTALGAARGEQLLRRNAARPGDQLWLSAGLGRSQAAFLALEGKIDEPKRAQLPEEWTRRYLCPEPRLALGRALALKAPERRRPAVMDISDGLGMDARRMALASGIAMAFELEQLAAEGLAEIFGEASREMAWSSGEEYELLIAASPEWAGDLASLGCKRVGLALDGTAGELSDRAGRVLQASGFDHFESPRG